MNADQADQRGSRQQKGTGTGTGTGTGWPVLFPSCSDPRASAFYCYFLPSFRRLVQAQRLSSVGALASSVAHEFNNILTTIINYTRLALRHPQDEVARTQALEKILKGSQRAATIINSMLGFARNNSTQRERTDLV